MFESIILLWRNWDSNGNVSYGPQDVFYKKPVSVIKHKAQRVAVLIDVQNLYHSAKNLYNARVNFKEVIKHVVAGRQLVRAIAYVIKTESGDEKPFLEALD